MRIYNLFSILVVTMLLVACGSDKSTALQDGIPNNNKVTTYVNFDLDPDNTVIPFPTNILFSGSLDGTLNIPAQTGDTAGQTAVKASLNALDGFSTVAPISIGFTDAMDATTFPTGVRVFEVSQDLSNPALPLVDGIAKELTFGIDFVAVLSSLDTSNASMVILPLAPLKPKSTYMVTLTSALKSADGNPVGPAQTYVILKGAVPLVDGGGNSQSALLDDAQAAQLEPLRQITRSGEANLLATDNTIGAADIIMSWQFTTQSTSDVLDKVRTDVRALTASSGFSPGVSFVAGGADIHVGVLDVPYYLTASSTASSPSNDPTALGSFWQGAGGSNLTKYNTTAVATSTQTIPMMVSIPNGSAMPIAGWPVIIFQHGITLSRASLLVIANTLASGGFAAVAIDLPMHGITGNETDGSAGFKDNVNGERTFDLDLVTQNMAGSITVPAPDAIIDSSGRHFINLTNLRNTRDNVRQAVSDLFALVDAIEEGAVTDGANIMDANNIYFIGHSLGAMVGTTFLALEPDVKDAVLANSGVSFPKILDGSAAFGGEISTGLAANGVVKGTTDYEAFLASAQNVIGSGDPVNYATSAAVGRGILLFEIVGGNSSLSDLVVPNTVPDTNDTTGTIPAPLAGTEPQIALMGLTHINATPTTGTDLKLVTKFTSGDHGSLLSPVADAAVTTEMQNEAVTFLINSGNTVTITDDTILAVPAAP